MDHIFIFSDRGKHPGDVVGSGLDGFFHGPCGWRCPGMFVCKLDLDLLKDIETNWFQVG